jgi:hypothetical protein
MEDRVCSFDIPLYGELAVSKYHNDHTAATDPGGIRLSRLRSRRLEPLASKMPNWTAGRFANRDEFDQMLDEHMQLGDSRAACVMSVEPLLVAAYTDELDCVTLLGFPAWLVEEYRLKAGGRLLTVNTYTRGQHIAPDLAVGPRQLGRWVNFFPVIAEFVSDDLEQIAGRKAMITEEEWARCEYLGRASLRIHPNRRRNGSPFWSGQPVA